MPERATGAGAGMDALERGSHEPLLLVDVDGFEGPLDLLLTLARQQKVDLARISITALADQYLQFIDKARLLRLELAADYLLMAAWLAYLKSRLLLPDEHVPDEPSGQELAEALALRLQRLEGIRLAGARLMERARLGRETFARGQAAPVSPIGGIAWEANLTQLLKAYAGIRQKQALSRVTMAPREVWSLETARHALRQLAGMAGAWTALDQFIMAYLPDPRMRATALASSFSASLELVREGVIDLQQESPFATLYVRHKGDTHE